MSNNHHYHPILLRCHNCPSNLIIMTVTSLVSAPIQSSHWRQHAHSLTTIFSLFPSHPNPSKQTFTQSPYLCAVIYFAASFTPHWHQPLHNHHPLTPSILYLPLLPTPLPTQTVSPNNPHFPSPELPLTLFVFTSLSSKFLYLPLITTLFVPSPACSHQQLFSLTPSSLISLLSHNFLSSPLVTLPV